jgi:hypothetical protein
MSKEEEKEFNEWLESIEFIKEDGAPSPHVLTKDESSDPEGDRG